MSFKHAELTRRLLACGGQRRPPLRRWGLLWPFQTTFTSSQLRHMLFASRTLHPACARMLVRLLDALPHEADAAPEAPVLRAIGDFPDSCKRWRAPPGSARALSWSAVRTLTKGGRIYHLHHFEWIVLAELAYRLIAATE